MWIVPRAHSSPGMFWIKIRDNEFYEMLEAKGGTNSGALLGGVVSVVLASSEKNALKYRIVLKSAVPQVVAVSHSYDQILKHWLFTEELLTKANTIDSESTEKHDFMLAKIASMAETAEEEEEDQNSEYYIAKFHRDFNLGEDQKLLTYFRCSLWDSMPTKGILFLTKDFFCYTAGTPHKVRVVVAFRDILSISKESTLMGLFSNSIKIVCCDEKEKTKKKTYYITFITREEAYSTLSQLWQRAIEHLENPPPPPSPSITENLSFSSDNDISQNTTTTTPVSPSIPTISVSATDSPVLSPLSRERRRSKPLPPLPSDDSSSSPAPALSPSLSLSPVPSLSLSSTSDAPPSIASLNLNSETPDVSSPAITTTSITNSPMSPAPSVSVSAPESPSPMNVVPPSPSLSSFPPSPNLNSNDPSKYGLDREKRNADFQALFKLPPSESLMEEYWCSVWRKSYVVGKLYVSRNFCCFHANINKELTIVISFYQIGSIQKERSMGFISNAIKVITLNNREFFFVLYNRDGAFLTMNNLWKTHVQSNRKVKVPPLADITQFGWSVAQETLPKESEELINFKKQQWNKYFKKNAFSIEMMKTQKLRELVRNGINSDLRGPVWVLCSGALHSWEVDPTLYSTLLERHKDQVSTATEEIEKDLHRTLAHHAYFQTPEAIQQLRNVLTAYSWRNPSIGYCQAMNVVCAAMLMHTTEEASFWLMSVICEDLLKGYYNTAMIGSIVDQKIFENLTESYFPKLYAHLNNVGLPITILSLPWFMCLFIGYIPWEVSMRVIDCVFYEGSLVLFQVALAVLKLNHDAILQEEDSERIVDMLKKRQYDSEALMQVTFRDFEFPPDKLTELRNAHKYKTVRHIN